MTVVNVVNVDAASLVSAQLRRQASSDSLTGLANHRRLFDILQAEIFRSKRTEREFSLLLLDLDGLKVINDRFGQLAGNRALCRLAQTLGDCCRSIDTAARQGGDEFALALPETGASVPSPARLEEFVHQFRESHYVSQCSGLLVGLSLSSYFIRELLVCWLFFSLLFVCVALLLLSGVLAVQAGEYLTVWARTLAGMTPVVALAHSDLPLKVISDARKLE